MTEPMRRQPAPPAVRSRRRLGCLASAAAGVVVGILLAVVALVLLAPPHTVPSSSAAGPANATLTLDNAFLSQLSADALSQATLPFALANVRASIHPGNQITFTADATVGPLTRPLAATGILTADGGRLRVQVTQASVGGLSLPAPINATLTAALNAKLATLDNLLQFGGTSYAITTVTSREGLLTLGLAPAS